MPEAEKKIISKFLDSEMMRYLNLMIAAENIEDFQFANKWLDSCFVIREMGLFTIHNIEESENVWSCLFKTKERYRCYEHNY